MEPKRLYYFDSFCVDSAQRVLLRDGQIVSLGPKAFELLFALVERSGKVISREELTKRVWPDTTVEPGNLPFNINVLRKTLRNNGSGREYIQNIRGRGYRLLADVTIAEGGNGSAGSPKVAVGSPTGVLETGNLSILESRAAEDRIPPKESHTLNGQPLETPQAPESGFRGHLHQIARLVRWTSPEQAGHSGRIPTPTAAFRGLLPFEQSDADRFYGRDIDSAALFDLVSHSDFRFGVLYGESGSGKSSLIRAGLLPRLNEAGLLGLYCRAYKDPISAMKEQCFAHTGMCAGQDEAPLDYLGRVTCSISRGLVVVFDQFEEFFANLKTQESQAPFVSFVGQCFHSPGLPVRILFGIRSDFLYLIASAFDEPIPETLSTSRRFHLRHFDKDQAALVLRKSMQRANWQFESGLVQKVADDLAFNDVVLPSELQIVGEQLQRKRIFTLEGYRRAGGKQRLMRGHLEDVMKATGNLQAARSIRLSLISEEDLRLTLTAEEIARRSRQSLQAALTILKIFADSGLVRLIQDEEPWRYELVHEYLIPEIKLTEGNAVDRTRRANAWFRMHLSEYAVDRRVRIPLARAWYIRRHSDIERGSRERELLNKSLRRGLARAVVPGLLLVALALVLAALLSKADQWEGVRLTDGHSQTAMSAAFSPDGRLVASVGSDGSILVWDVAGRQKLASLPPLRTALNAVAFSPDGKLIAAAGNDGSITVWQISDWSMQTELRCPRSGIGTVAFSPDGRILAGAAGVQVFLWRVNGWQALGELPDGQRIPEWVPSSAVEAANRLGCHAKIAARSPDMSRLVALSDDGSVSFCNLHSNKIVTHQSVHHLFARAVAFSSNGNFVATAAEDVVLWDAETEVILGRFSHTDNVWGVTFSPDSRSLVSTHGDGAILVWDIAERRCVANLNEHSGPVNSVAFSPDGNTVASAGADRSVIVWDARRNTKSVVLNGHSAGVLGLAFANDGRSLTSADGSGTVINWDLSQDPPRPRSVLHLEVDHYAISADGTLAASKNGIYEVARGTRINDFGGRLLPEVGTSAAAFSPDGRWFVCAKEGRLLLWDIQKSDLVDLSEESTGQEIIIRMAVSPNGEWLATGGIDGAVWLWRLGPLRRVALLGRHATHVQAVAFSPDSSLVATASDDWTVALWDVQGRRFLTRVGTHIAPVLSVAFSPDGNRLACGGQDKSVRIYTRHRTLLGRRLN